MNGDRASEQERRELAQQNRGKVIPDSGRVVEARKLGQMVSLRLDPEIVGDLRRVADWLGRSMSDVVREAVVDYLHNLGRLHVSIAIEAPECGIGGLIRVMDAEDSWRWTATSTDVELASPALTSVSGHWE